MEPLPEAVKQFITEAKVGRIASVRPDGTPHVIPVCPAFDGEATVYVDIASGGVSAAAFRANPSLTAIVDEYYDDWSKLRAVILRCRGEALSGEELERAWVLFREKFPQGQAIGWSARLTLALRIGDWSEWGITKALPYEPE